MGRKVAQISSAKQESKSKLYFDATDSTSIIVPKNNIENRELKCKHNFVDDDNEDIAYLNFPLIWPIGIISFLSLAFFIFSFVSIEFINHLSFERYALNQLVFTYGKTIGFCNVASYYFLLILLISLLILRVAVCVPMIIRILIAFVIKNDMRENLMEKGNSLIYWLNELSGPIYILEVFSLALVSIVTIRFDFPKIYNAAFGIFVLTSTIYMYLRTILSFFNSPAMDETLERIAVATRLVCTVVFTWTISQFFQNHQRFILHTGCHGYVTKGEALTEYFAITSYAIFHLTQLVEIRDVRFICYPRTCSGECEPLRPNNFTKNGKYAYCRAYEYAQHQTNRKFTSLHPASCKF